MSSLKRSCLVVEMNELKVFEIVKVLRRICLKEGIEVSEGVLGDVAVRCKGDVRAAINDLQVAYMVGFSKLGIGEREREGEIEGALRSVFNGCTRLDVFDNVGEDLDGCFLWIDENMPLEFFGSSLVRGYEMLSMAD